MAPLPYDHARALAEHYPPIKTLAELKTELAEIGYSIALPLIMIKEANGARYYQAMINGPDGKSAYNHRSIQELDAYPAYQVIRIRAEGAKHNGLLVTL
jgi:hypothetical protein